MALMGGDSELDSSMELPVEDEPLALARAAVGNVCPEAVPSFDPAAQLADLERDGVYGAVLIGRISVFKDDTPAEVDVAYCQLVNDWLAETWRPYLDRVAPAIYLPFSDVAASVRELERAAAMGLRPALLPDGIFDRPYHLAEWEPLWEAANALKVPLYDARRRPALRPDPVSGVPRCGGRRLVQLLLRHGGDPRMADLQRGLRPLSGSARRHDGGLRRMAGICDPILRSSLERQPPARPRRLAPGRQHRRLTLPRATT